jgi:hypothetical protein
MPCPAVACAALTDAGLVAPVLGTCMIPGLVSTDATCADVADPAGCRTLPVLTASAVPRLDTGTVPDPTAPVASANCCACSSTVARRETGWVPVLRLLLGLPGLLLLVESGAVV